MKILGGKNSKRIASLCCMCVRAHVCVSVSGVLSNLTENRYLVRETQELSRETLKGIGKVPARGAQFPSHPDTDLFLSFLYRPQAFPLGFPRLSPSTSIPPVTGTGIYQQN